MTSTATRTGFDLLVNGLVDTVDALVRKAAAAGVTDPAEVRSLVLGWMRELAA